MSSFSHDQKIALLVVPLLLFGVLGLSSVGRGAALFVDDGEVEQRRGQGGSSSDVEKHISLALLESLRLKDYAAFVKALKETPYGVYAERNVFDALVHSYELHMQGNSTHAHDYFVRTLYG